MGLLSAINPFGDILGGLQDMRSKMLGGFGLGALDPTPRASPERDFPAAYTSDELPGDARARQAPTVAAAPAPALQKAGPAEWRAAIRQIESGSPKGRYDAVGPRHPKLGRALGAYQVMEANIAPWSKAALGYEIDADTFLKNPDLQDKIFDAKFGQYARKYGPSGAAQAWFAGEGGVGKNRKDSLGTSTGKYAMMFERNLGRLGPDKSAYERLADGPKGEEVYPRRGPAPTVLAQGLPDEMIPPGTQRIPGSKPPMKGSGSKARVVAEDGSTTQAPQEPRTPVGMAFQQYKVNRSTRMLRSLGPAATIGVLAAIGSDARLLREQAQAREPGAGSR
jgi:hypothetical protein